MASLVKPVVVGRAGAKTFLFAEGNIVPTGDPKGLGAIGEVVDGMIQLGGVTDLQRFFKFGAWESATDEDLQVQLAEAV